MDQAWDSSLMAHHVAPIRAEAKRAKVPMVSIAMPSLAALVPALFFRENPCHQGCSVSGSATLSVSYLFERNTGVKVGVLPSNVSTVSGAAPHCMSNPSL